MARRRRPADPRRVLRPGTAPDRPEFPLAQRLLDIAVRLRDLLPSARRRDLGRATGVVTAVPPLWTRGMAGRVLTAPASGTELAPGVTLYHDGKTGAPVVGTRPDAAGGWGVFLTAEAFDGGFLSLAIDLSAAQLAALGRGAEVLVRADFSGPAAAPPTPARDITARLSCDSGQGDPWHLSRTRPLAPGGTVFALDLADLPAAARMPHKAWVDLIVGHPDGLAVTIADLSITVGPRQVL